MVLACDSLTPAANGSASTRRENSASWSSIADHTSSTMNYGDGGCALASYTAIYYTNTTAVSLSGAVAQKPRSLAALERRELPLLKEV